MTKDYNSLGEYIGELVKQEKFAKHQLNHTAQHVYRKFKNLMKDFANGYCDSTVVIEHLNLFRYYFENKTDYQIENLHLEEIEAAYKEHVPGAK